MPKDKEKDTDKKKKKEAKAAKEDKEEASEPKEEDKAEDDESEKEEAPKRRKRKRKEPKGSTMMDKLWNLITLGIAGGLMYCRYNGIPVPYVDDFILYMKGQAGLGGSGAQRHDAHSTLADVKDGKAIVLEDLLMQLNRFCGSRGRCSDDYWEALPNVAIGLKRGPGTWDRKPLKKAKAQEIDDILAKMAKQPSARKLPNWKALRDISKELFDVTPKSMKPSLASKLAYESKTPPAAGSAEPEEEEKKPKDDIVVDDL
eukprot:TRINITY_DN16129_c0_g1_i2.p1 TRINITY_DN16129_c0_g1~~TRINITY_DN16129_c0_g1_i2.p1  ORF type:complete len:258 (-),score=78.14 TRINITY_DN16129_c0_g1_i2:136-909(-)